MHNSEELAELYEAKLPVLNEASHRLRRHLEDVLRHAGDPQIVRARLLPLRVKTLDSVSAKADGHGWSGSDAIYRCPDIVGARIVCNNVADVYRIAELVKEMHFIGDPSPSIQNYMQTPKPSGYRALHINLRVDAGEALHYDYIGCEIQVRTLLQDAWSHLSHDDLYKKGASLPVDLQGRASDLATILGAADEVAQRVRDRIGEERPAPGTSPDLSVVATDGLAHLFAQTFGRYAPQYVLKRALQVCRRVGLTDLQSVAAALADATLRERVAGAYSEVTRWRPSAEDIFLSIVGAGGDSGKAVRSSRRRARKAWDEIEAVAASEAASAMPGTKAEFEAQLDEEDLDLEVLANALGAWGECAICGATILRADALEEALCHHYDIDSLDGRVEAVAWQSGIEVGDFDNSSLCSYHGNLLAKDD